MKRGNGYHDDGPPRKLLRNDDPSKLLRVLIPSRAAGPIIGKGGDTIKELRAQVSIILLLIYAPLKNPHNIVRHTKGPFIFYLFYDST